MVVQVQQQADGGRRQSASESVHAASLKALGCQTLPGPRANPLPLNPASATPTPRNHRVGNQESVGYRPQLVEGGCQQLRQQLVWRGCHLRLARRGRLVKALAKLLPALQLWVEGTWPQGTFASRLRYCAATGANAEPHQELPTQRVHEQGDGVKQQEVLHEGGETQGGSSKRPRGLEKSARNR